MAKGLPSMPDTLNPALIGSRGGDPRARPPGNPATARRWRLALSLAIFLPAAVYSTTPLLFEVSPAFGRFLPALAFSLVYVLPAAVYCGVLGMIGLLIAWRRRAAAGFGYRLAATAGLGTVMILALCWQTSSLIRRGLPVGSLSLSFDSSRWKQQGLAGRGFTDRQAMLGDLARNILQGKSRTEVVNLLGPSEKGGSEADTGDLGYRTGRERWLLPIDDEWLLISFDSSGRFSRFRVATFDPR
jgi:hypothetical protein